MSHSRLFNRNGAIIFVISLSVSLVLSCSKEQVDEQRSGQRPYPEELAATIGRGLIGLPQDNNRIFLTWRLLPSDPVGISFNVYRKEVGIKHNDFELIAKTDVTSYIDADLREEQQYYYAITHFYSEKEGPLTTPVSVTTTEKGQNALVFDLGQAHKFARVVSGDLNGDGELEVVVAYSNSPRLDPADRKWNKKSEDTIKLAAFLHTGRRLWMLDLGWGIEVGAVYAPIVLWDIDADGREEVILKTNKSSDPDDFNNERLTILDGETGAIRRQAEWPKPIGDGYNNASRNFLAIAHLDGKHPYIIVARGLYQAQRIWAYDNKLNRVWERIIGLDNYATKDLSGRLWKLWHYENPFEQIWGRLTGARLTKDFSRGSHSLPVADVDGDGREEIFWGEHTIGLDGEDIWAIDERVPYNGHPDIVFVADISPATQGKEVFYAREGWNGKDESIGMLLASSAGDILWEHWGYTHIDGGWVARISHEDDGMQSYGFDVQSKKWTASGDEYEGVAHYLWSSDGKPLTISSDHSWKWSFPVDWDGDEVREICTYDGDVVKYKGSIVARLGSLKGHVWGADLFGDHREEIVVSSGDRHSSKVLVYFNTEPLDFPPRITRIADRQYKNDLSRTAMQFNVVPTIGGYIPKSHLQFEE